jgi:hypothetical protein
MPEPVAVMVPLSEVWRWLRRKGIRPHGRGVLLSDVKAKWPELHAALTLGTPTSTPCPDCGAPTHTACTVCDFSLVHGGA